jgi:hypothetical protein
VVVDGRKKERMERKKRKAQSLNAGVEVEAEAVTPTSHVQHNKKDITITFEPMESLFTCLVVWMIVMSRPVCSEF